MQLVNDNIRQKWKSLVDNMDMTRNSKKAWNTIKHIIGDPKAIRQHIYVTSNQITHALLKNVKPENKIKVHKRPGTKKTKHH